MTKRRHPRLISFVCYPFFKVSSEHESSPHGTGRADQSNRLHLAVVDNIQNSRLNTSQIFNETGGAYREESCRLTQNRYRETRV